MYISLGVPSPRDIESHCFTQGGCGRHRGIISPRYANIAINPSIYERPNAPQDLITRQSIMSLVLSFLKEEYNNIFQQNLHHAAFIVGVFTNTTLKTCKRCRLICIFPHLFHVFAKAAAGIQYCIMHARF
jgi:hypothetical protein